MKRFSKTSTSLLMTLVLAGVAPRAEAYLLTASSGSLAASANFSAAAGQLTIVLTNTSLADVLVPSDVLTAVFFTVAGDPVLTPGTALLSGGSVVWYGPDGGGNIGGEWTYANSLSASAPGGADEGVSTAGFGLFNGNHFAGPNLDGPVAVNGMNYGILSAGDDPASGNTPVTGGNPLVQNQVTFTLTGLASDFVADRTTITNVSFQYGTSLTEPNVRVVPEPATILALGSGLAGLGALRLRRRKKV